jgi:MFS family permease
MSASWPILNSLVADITPGPSQKLAFSLLYWGNNVGFSIGPLAAGFLFNSAPRMLFVGNALVLLAAGFLVLRIRDKPAAAQTVSGVSLPGTSVFLLLKERPLILLFGLSALAGAFIYSQHTFSVPLLLNERFGGLSGPKLFGMLMSLNGLTVVVCTLPITALSRKWPTLISVAVSTLIYGIGFGLYGIALSVFSIALLTFTWTLGEIIGATNTNVFVAQKSPPEYRSRMNSFISLCYTAGNFLGPLVMGALIEIRGLAYVWPVLLVVGAVTAVYLCLLWLWSGKKSVLPA